MAQSKHSDDTAQDVRLNRPVAMKVVGHSVWQTDSTYALRAASGSSDFPNDQIFPRIFFPHWPLW